MYEKEIDGLQIAQFRAFLIRESHFYTCRKAMADALKPLYSKRYTVGVAGNCGIFWEFLRKTGRVSE